MLFDPRPTQPGRAQRHRRLRELRPAAHRT